MGNELAPETTQERLVISRTLSQLQSVDERLGNASDNTFKSSLLIRGSLLTGKPTNHSIGVELHTNISKNAVPLDPTSGGVVFKHQYFDRTLFFEQLYSSQDAIFRTAYVRTTHNLQAQLSRLIVVGVNNSFAMDGLGTPTYNRTEIFGVQTRKTPEYEETSSIAISSSSSQLFERLTLSSSIIYSSRPLLRGYSSSFSVCRNGNLLSKLTMTILTPSQLPITSVLTSSQISHRQIVGAGLDVLVHEDAKTRITFYFRFPRIVGMGFECNF